MLAKVACRLAHSGWWWDSAQEHERAAALSCAELAGDPYRVLVGRWPAVEWNGSGFVQDEWPRERRPLFAPDEILPLWRLLERGDLRGVMDLRFGFLGLGNDGARLLLDGMGGGQTPLLRSLDLRGNRLGADGAVAVGKAAPVLLALEELDLGQNKLGVRGARSLDSLRGLPRLHELSMDRCGLGDLGIEVFVGRLGQHDYQALHTLGLNGNHADGGDGIAAMTAALDRGCFGAIDSAWRDDGAVAEMISHTNHGDDTLDVDDDDDDDDAGA